MKFPAAPKVGAFRRTVESLTLDANNAFLLAELGAENKIATHEVMTENRKRVLVTGATGFTGEMPYYQRLRVVILFIISLQFIVPLAIQICTMKM